MCVCVFFSLCCTIEWLFLYVFERFSSKPLYSSTKLRFGDYQLIVPLLMKHVYTAHCFFMFFLNDQSKLMAIPAHTPRILDLRNIWKLCEFGKGTNLVMCCFFEYPNGVCVFGLKILVFLPKKKTHTDTQGPKKFGREKSSPNPRSSQLPTLILPSLEVVRPQKGGSFPPENQLPG